MATILQLRRGTTTQHSTFTGAVGEVTVDTTKDTVVVHDGVTAGGFALAKESDIAGYISLTDLSAGTGISYNNTTGAIAVDTDTIATKSYVTTQIQTKDNTDEITEGTTNKYFTDARARGAISITDSGGDGSLAYNSSTGVITYTGPSATEVRAHFSAGSGITITSGSIAVDTSTIATKTYADSAATTAVAAVINSAPAALDTLNELATALGNDANFSATVTTALGTKLATSDFTSTANTWLGTKTTDNVTEGTTNKYFSTSLARGAFSAGTGVTITSGSIAIGQSVASTADVVFNSVTASLIGNVTGNVSGNAGTVTNGVYTTDTGTVTNTMLAGSIANAKLVNSKVTIGSTDVSLGATVTTIAGLTSVTSTSFVGALTGNASTVTNGVYTTDTGTVTNTMLAGSIANNKLANSSISINGSAVSLGGSVTGLAVTSGKLSQFAATTSAELAGVISDETGSGALVFANSPTLVTPALGTPSSVTLTNATGLPVSTGISGLGTGVATFLATPSSANLAAALTDETGTGKVVFSADPTFTGTINGANLSLSGNLTVSGTTYTVNSTNVSYTDNIIELHNTADSSPLLSDDGKDIGLRFHYFKTTDKQAFLGWANDSQAIEYYVDGTETNGVFSGTYGKFKGAGLIATGSTSGTTTLQASATASGTLTLPAATDTLVGKATTDTLTNKTIAAGSNTISGLTNSNLSGSAGITNANLANSSVTINGVSVSLGASGTVKASTTNALTIGTGLSGTSFDGSAAVTVAIDSTVATLTGTQTLTNKTISGASNTLSNIGNSSLTNSSITLAGTAVSLGGAFTAQNMLDAIKTVDGTGSGLDADLLDGQSAAYFRINVYDAAGTLLN